MVEAPCRARVTEFLAVVPCQARCWRLHGPREALWVAQPVGKRCSTSGAARPPTSLCHVACHHRSRSLMLTPV